MDVAIQESTPVTWDVLLKLLNERFPLLVAIDGQRVTDRVGRAITTGDQPDGRRSLHITTYRDQRHSFDGIDRIHIAVHKTDKQGVLIAYTVILSGENEHKLEFFA